MKTHRLLLLICSLVMCFALSACGSSSAPSGQAAASGVSAKTSDAAPAASLPGKKTLIAYFSYSGTTQRAAQDAAKITGGDLFRIETVTPYPGAYRECTEVAKAELKQNRRPALKTPQVPGLKDYEVVFIGYPIWWHEAPMAVYSFIEQNDLSGKTVVLFCTSGGNSIDQTLPRLHKALPNATIIDGITVNRPTGIDEWLGKLGYKAN